VPRAVTRGTREGRGEIVTGMVMLLLGENSRTVVHAAKARLAEIQDTHWYHGQQRAQAKV